MYMFFKQWRLFPYLAAAVVLKMFATKITDVYINMFVRLIEEDEALPVCVQLY